jgi:hypothetical protein
MSTIRLNSKKTMLFFMLLPAVLNLQVLFLGAYFIKAHYGLLLQNN